MELFDRKLAETEADVDPIPRQSAPIAEGLSVELAEVAVKAPGAAVMEAHARVERRVREILVEANLAPSRPIGVRQLAREAAHHGLISNESVRAIEGITVMRNLAAHGPSSDITADRAREYLDLVDAVMFGLVPPR